jgi:hypothetical protein
VFLSKREKVTIGVYGDTPFIYSYSKKTNLAHIVYFDKENFVNVPEEYGWYSISGVNLLADIENKQNQIMKNVFQELAGTFVDIVIYPKKGTVLAGKNEQDFISYFLKQRKEVLSSDRYKISTRNKFDRYLLRDKLNLRPNRLIVTNMQNQFVREDKKNKYIPDKLDIKLKGYFYQDILTSSNYRVIIHTHRADYTKAVRLARYIEGVGINVVDYVIEEEKIRNCKYVFNNNNQAIELLKNYIDCRTTIDGKLNNFIHLYINESFIKNYI